MLLPDNMNPELSIYYNGAVVIEELNKKNSQTLFELYQNVKAANNISFSTFILSLDWLFLIDAAIINDKEVVVLCS